MRETEQGRGVRNARHFDDWVDQDTLFRVFVRDEVG